MMRNVPAPRARRAVLTVCALLAALHGPLACAHSDEFFDTRPSAHGGQTRMAGPIHIELVAAGTTITLYITDHADQPQPTASGKARLRIEGSDAQIELTPAGDNRFTGTLPRALAADTPVIAFVQLAGADAQSARFGPKAATSHGEAHGDGHARGHGHDHTDMHGGAHEQLPRAAAQEHAPANAQPAPDEAHAHDH